jgi:RNA polymerase primary sigma factor
MLDLLCDESEKPPDFVLEVASLKIEIANALSTLTVREAEVITNYFGLNGTNPMTLEEIGQNFCLTRERVRQIKEKATRRLRGFSRSKVLRTYLG